ncbi:MAG: phosphate regulon transcriptional regulator PhoB [Pseudomonadota bacterium]|nr:phosphate regulon transcriptional regulator PhoB [Gammaproteobacteria bacterium]MDQ3582881.1 phosphate regulon transcriptional regulator PhoB [Pseudomonadota bacterium]
MTEKILIVDDEPGLRQMLGFALTGAGFACSEVADAEKAELAIARETPDLVLLDWMLPGVSGVDLARRLKRDARTRVLPIIMLTARGEEGDKVRALEVGADDYVTKPFSTRELVARIKAVLRRSAQEQVEGEAIEIDGLRIDTKTHRVLARGVPLPLSPTEFRLLHFFIAHPERVYTRSQLLDQVWGSNVYIEERTVDVHIRRLRKTLAPYRYDQMIQTVRSVGYRFSNQ